MRHFRVAPWLGALLIALAGCTPDNPESTAFRLSGDTMGTRWHVTVVGEAGESLTTVIPETLAAVDATMSTYRPDSALSRLNAAPAGTAVPVPTSLMAVLTRSRTLHDWTDGAFNPAVGPWVNRWGFGPPSQKDESVAGFSRDFAALRLEPSTGTVIKPAPMQLDLSAIAKGYAVDRVAAVLEAAGVTDYLVEVGGELRVRGRNPNGDPWRVAIERPTVLPTAVETVLHVQEGGIATSGDYRNFREVDGERISHAVDPHSGEPVRNRLTSVTVVAEDAMTADALATGLMVMGEVRALALAERRDWPVLMLVRDEQGYHTVTSPAMAPLLRAP